MNASYLGKFQFMFLKDNCKFVVVFTFLEKQFFKTRNITGVAMNLSFIGALNLKTYFQENHKVL